MDAAALAAIPAILTALGALLQGLRIKQSVGSKNGLGTVQEALHTINQKQDAQTQILGDLVHRVGRLEDRSN